MFIRHYLRKFNFTYYIKRLMVEDIKEIKALTTKVKYISKKL